MARFWNEPTVFTQIFEVGFEKDVFNLDNAYRAGELTVYFNGIWAVEGQDWDPVNNMTIKFRFQCLEGDVVVCHIRREG